MTPEIPITEEAVRASLLERATAYCKANRSSFSHIGDKAVSDSKFLARVQSGENFTIKTYQKVLTWLDEAEGRATPSETGQGRAVA